MITFRLLFSRRYWWQTLIVLLAMAVMAGLGQWQLARLEQRRAANGELLAKLQTEALVITGGSLAESPDALEDRLALVTGEYDFARQIAVQGQFSQEAPGYWLLTPLRIAGSGNAILVNRGWIPAAAGETGEWAAYDETPAQPLRGYLQRSRKMPDGSTSALPADVVKGWWRVDIEAIQSQMPYPLLPVALQVAPDESRGRNELPQRVPVDFDLSEGSHMIYALQWYAFALIAGAIYVVVLRRRETATAEKE
ncbi:MAG: SURF1 family protein [Caldilineaceae bacterium]|nr:SURF1 family protein [Caldilineaceae bacterium]HRJ43673.1 SURF1 family protein [Caldilineaceae bacterium]